MDEPSVKFEFLRMQNVCSEGSNIWSNNFYFFGNSLSTTLIFNFLAKTFWEVLKRYLLRNRWFLVFYKIQVILINYLADAENLFFNACRKSWLIEPFRQFSTRFDSIKSQNNLYNWHQSVQTEFVSRKLIHIIADII